MAETRTCRRKDNNTIKSRFSEYGTSYVVVVTVLENNSCICIVLVDAPLATNDNVIFDDRVERAFNKFGRYARLGTTGKFYCGGELDGFRCFCCNGQCGPSNGCNCSGCMLLDVQKRQLPRGWLVNFDGASARLSREEPTKFYCGRLVLMHDKRSHGYCGPTNGEQCTACRKLNEQQHQRYGEILRC